MWESKEKYKYRPMNKQNKCIKITYLVMLLVDYTKIPITYIDDDLKTYNLYKTVLILKII